MEQKIIFREMLSEVKALADSQDNRLTTREIDDFFANTHLNPDQMEMIYDYLVSQKIQVDGYEGKTNTRTSDALPERGREDTAECAETEYAETERPVSMELYLEEVSRMKRPDPEEELKLFQMAGAGDADAKSRLVELYLTMVCELAGDYDGQDLPVEDLIQEGNIGLLMAVDALETRDSLAAYQVQLMNAVNDHMQKALQEHRDIREMGNGIASRVNHLSQAIRNLEEDLEHRVSLEELSAYLEMPLEEIRDILKMAGDELEVKQEP